MKMNLYPGSALRCMALTVIMAAGSILFGCDQADDQAVGMSQTNEAVKSPVSAKASPVPEYAESIPDLDFAKARRAAKGRLKIFLSSIPEGKEKAFGFDSRKQFQSADLGLPYRVVSLNPDEMKSGKASPQFNFSSQLRFPVIADGKARALLTVELEKEIWQAVDFGASGMARELSAIIENADDKADGADRYILRLYQLKADVLVTTPGGRHPASGLFWPLRSAKAAMQGIDETKAAQGFSFSELLPAMRVSFGKWDGK